MNKIDFVYRTYTFLQMIRWNRKQASDRNS